MRGLRTQEGRFLMGMTGYIDKQLRRTGERVVYRARLSWIPMFISTIPAMWLTCLVAGTVKGLTGNSGYAGFVIFVGVLVTLITKIRGIIRNLGTDIVVSERRLHSKRGIVNLDDIHDTPLTNIDNTVNDPTVFGRIFGYGDVSIHTFGGGPDSNSDFTFKSVVDPGELVAVINETRDGLVAGGQNPYAAFQQQNSQRARNNGRNRTSNRERLV